MSDVRIVREALMEANASEEAFLAIGRITNALRLAEPHIDPDKNYDAADAELRILDCLGDEFLS